MPTENFIERVSKRRKKINLTAIATFSLRLTGKPCKSRLSPVDESKSLAKSSKKKKETRINTSYV